MQKQFIIGIDAGTLSTGIAVVVDGIAKHGHILKNEDVVRYIRLYCLEGNVTCSIEDIRGYECRFSQDTIDTCKYLGELQYCLKQARIEYTLVPRSTVKNWLFKDYPNTVVPRVEKIIRQRKKVTKSGEFRKASFVYVDDRVVGAVMRDRWALKKPKPGHKTEHGFVSHAIQALAVATYYLEKCGGLNNATTPIP